MPGIDPTALCGVELTNWSNEESSRRLFLLCLDDFDSLDIISLMSGPDMGFMRRFSSMEHDDSLSSLVEEAATSLRFTTDT